MGSAMNLRQMEQKLQKADRKQARLYLFCNFIALMIISAYSALMLSPTVQKVFPEGGDSAKQMYMIFVMTLVGCVVFTIYALRLFFRHKSGQLGVLMALGASRKRLAPGLYREVVFLSGVSAIAGTAAGFPFVWVIWHAFRLFLVDSSEMVLIFDFRCLFISLLFLFLVVGSACLTAWRYLKKTNIMEVIREEHINEPVKELGRWCGPVGFLVLLTGAVMGFSAPQFWHTYFSSYPPDWVGIFYAPVFGGLYMIMLHTAVHGWKSRRKNPYKNIISRSMMKFQGKQTVNNMLVITLLIAGGCFAIFYLPTNGISALVRYASAPFDYFYHDRADQNVPGREEVEALGREYGLTFKDFNGCDYVTLGIGGRTAVEEEDGLHYHIEYVPMLSEAKVLSEDAYLSLTGQTVDVKPGTYLNVTNQEETALATINSAKEFTNMVTRRQFATQFAGYLHYDLLVETDIPCCVVDNADYAEMSEGLTDEWRGRFTAFNVDGKDSYSFANAFYRLFVSSFDESCERVSYYDRVQKIRENEAGKEYWVDTDDMAVVSYDMADSFMFRTFWLYQPDFRILNQNDYLRSMAVMFMMFLFIFIVCMITALVVCYTRCQSIVLNNRYIFGDLKKLGASPAFLDREVRSQCGSVFKVPSLVGTSAMFLLFSMILYANDGRIIGTEWAAMGVCLCITAAIGGVIYAVYRSAVKVIKGQLGIG